MDFTNSYPTLESAILDLKEKARKYSFELAKKGLSQRKNKTTIGLR